MSNPLKIQEPLLLEFHNLVIDSFVHNNIPFEANYQHEPRNKSTVMYAAVDKLGKPRMGFICATKKKFGGAVYLDSYVDYLEKEGFTPEQLQKEKAFLMADSIQSFLALLLFKNLDSLEL